MQTLYNGLPVFSVIIDDDTIFNNISVVTAPAVERNFITLSKDVEIKFKVDSEKRTISGPILIADKPIYRRDEDGKEYYIKFDAETIKKYAEKFFRDGRQNEGNVEHQFSVRGITFYESYLINKERGICPKEFEDLPNGSWVASAYVDNDEVWQLVTDGTLRGFSVDIYAKVKEEKTELSTLNDFLEYINK